MLSSVIYLGWGISRDLLWVLGAGSAFTATELCRLPSWRKKGKPLCSRSLPCLTGVESLTGLHVALSSLVRLLKFSSMTIKIHLSDYFHDAITSTGSRPPIYFTSASKQAATGNPCL